MPKEFTDFPIEFRLKPPLSSAAEDDLYRESEETLRKLAKNHTDITGATIDITQPAENRETAYIYEATVVIHARPNTIAATEKNNDVGAALSGALTAAARQVRDKREQLRDH